MSLFTLAFGTGGRRHPGGPAGKAIKGYAAAVAVWTVYAAAFSRGDSLSLTIAFLALMLVMVFLLIGRGPESDPGHIDWHDWIFAGASAAAGGYFLYHAKAIGERITLLDPLSDLDMSFALLLIGLTLEAMRRTVGLGLTVLVCLFIVYNLYGDLLSGPLGHGEITLPHFVDIMAFTTDGLFGVPLRVAATYAFLFVMFGTALAKTGGADFFFDLAASISGRATGGPAKIAVISSGLYGTISGSPTSDVVTTGAVTIPMMKKMGYKSSFAGAVEVAASTGGSLLPPVMGAAAFIMSEYTGIPYIDIAFAAIIPALLYYLPIYLQVHLRAQKDGLRGMEAADIRPVGITLRNGGLFLVPLVVITWVLVEGYTPTYAAVYGTAAVAVVSMLKSSTRLTPHHDWSRLQVQPSRILAVGRQHIPVAGAGGRIDDSAGSRHADTQRLYPGRRAGGPGDDQSRHRPDGRPYVPAVFRGDVGADPAGRRRGLRRQRNFRRQSAGHSRDGGAHGTGRLPDPIQLRLQSGTVAAGQRAGDRLGDRLRRRRPGRHRHRHRRLSARPPRRPAAALSGGRRHPVALYRPAAGGNRRGPCRRSPVHSARRGQGHLITHRSEMRRSIRCKPALRAASRAASYSAASTTRSSSGYSPAR
jgi:hypothetical protein